MANRAAIHNVSVTFGNLPMVAGGLPLKKKAGKKMHYNVAPGQLVAYILDETTGQWMTIGAADLTSDILYSLYIGVGYDSNGDGTADSIRQLGAEDLNGCLLKDASATGPQCGNPEVKDFYFDCTECNETYSVMVSVDNGETRSFAPFNASTDDYIGTIVTECHTCDDCPVEHNCKEVACKMADALQNDIDLKIGDKPYPDWKGKTVERPYYVTKLHERSLVYCLTPETDEEACEDCTHYTAITEATVGGEVVEFMGTVDPLDDTKMLIAQLQLVADQLNEAFQEIGKHVGSAYVTHGSVSKCCPVQLHVNTCDDTFALVGADPKLEYNPFEEYGTLTKDPYCEDCEMESTEEQFTCGIRVITKPFEYDCNCGPLQKPLAFYGQKVEICPIGDGWTHGYWKTVDIQTMELPALFGASVQYAEYKATGGFGSKSKRFSRSNQLTQSAWIKGLHPNSRANLVTADCETNYCQYRLEFEKEYLSAGNSKQCKNILADVYIPVDDTDTKTEWELFANTLIELTPGCKPVGTITCENNIKGCDDLSSTSSSTK